MKTHLKKLGVAALLWAVVGACAAQSATAIQKLTLAVQAAKPDETRAAWSPLVEDMGKKLGVPATLITASQSEVVAALRTGQADVVWLSSSAAIDAVTQAGGEAFALYYNVNNSGNNANGYKGILVTRSDSGITTLEQALTPGKYSYASGAKTSTSGYVLPQHFLFNERKTTPEALFKSVVYGSHFDNLAALWAGKVDVVVNNTTDTEVFQNTREPAAKDKLRVLWESPLVPNDVLMFRADASDAVKAALRTFFLKTYGQTDSEKALYRQASGIRNFEATDNRLLQPVSEFKFATERAAIQANAKLSDSEKATALQKLDAQVDAFKRSLPPLK
jgi:phosphonate transport system substrate-binding protein